MFRHKKLLLIYCIATVMLMTACSNVNDKISEPVNSDNTSESSDPIVVYGSTSGTTFVSDIKENYSESTSHIDYAVTAAPENSNTAFSGTTIPAKVTEEDNNNTTKTAKKTTTKITTAKTTTVPTYTQTTPYIYTTVPVTTTVQTTTVTFPNEGVFVKSNLGYKIKAPEFLSEEQRQLFANAFEYSHNLVSEGYRGEYSDKEVLTLTVNGITSKYVPGNADLFPTYNDFKNFVYSIYPKDIADGELKRENFIDHNGKLYVRANFTGYDIDYLGQSFSLVTSTDEYVKFKIEAYYGTPDDYTIKESSYIMINTPDGWRFEQFIFWF